MESNWEPVPIGSHSAAAKPLKAVSEQQRSNCKGVQGARCKVQGARFKVQGGSKRRKVTAGMYALHWLCALYCEQINVAVGNPFRKL